MVLPGALETEEAYHNFKVENFQGMVIKKHSHS